MAVLGSYFKWLRIWIQRKSIIFNSEKEFRELWGLGIIFSSVGEFAL